VSSAKAYERSRRVADPFGPIVGRLRDSGAYRVIYAARRAEAVYVLHAFQKKSQATPKKDIDIARRRFAQLSRGTK
jgi:phage-related protein